MSQLESRIDGTFRKETQRGSGQRKSRRKGLESSSKVEGKTGTSLNCTPCLTEMIRFKNLNYQSIL